MSNPQQEVLTIMLEALAREAARSGPIQIVQAASGGYDVMLRLDGTYSSRDDAEASAEFLTGALLDAAQQLTILRASEVKAAGSGVPDLICAMNEQVLDQ